MNSRVVIGAALIVFVARGNAWAYEPDTHDEFARTAAKASVSSLDATLKSELGTVGGIDQNFLGKTVQELIGAGARNEDIPALRSLNHFHQPLVDPWDNAGLIVSLLGIPVARGQSSILWQQNGTQQDSTVTIGGLSFAVGGDNASWQDARRMYLDALTGAVRPDRDNSTPAGREQTFADLFRALGHLTHLVQDATVPAHARNDAHPDFIPFQYDGYEKWVERVRTKGDQRFKFDAVLNLPPMRPSTAIFTATANERAPAPIARLIDTDRFTGLNFSLLTDANLGAAEYSNGNFLSRDTIFQAGALPRVSSLGSVPFFEPEGSGVRGYFSKIAEGEGVPHFVATGMLFDSLNAQVGVPPAGGWKLTDAVHQDYAAKLIPRAVGFSAALLDYFFRGKLDVDVIPDAVDPSVVHVTGTNASDETLDGGILAVYADDPTGLRQPVPPLDAAAPFTAAPGGPVDSGRVQLPANAERVVAVYTGKVGDEVPAPNFPGAVIGKVLGGVRVEEVFSDGTRWQLRTPKGVFPLPILTKDVLELKWGDVDNTLVGRTLISQGAPNTMFAYEIARPVGSVDVPLVIQPDGTQTVDVKLKQQVSFPFGLDLGITVAFTHTIHYQQYFLSFVDTTIFVPGPFGYQEDSGIESDGRVDLLVNETRPLARSYPLTLDPTKLFNTSAKPYNWSYGDMALSTDGRILALVGFGLTSPGESTTFPAFELQALVSFSNESNGDIQPSVVAASPISVPLAFPSGLGPIAWVVIDVSAQRVLASTAPAVVTIDHHTAKTLLSQTGSTRARVFFKEKYVGGPLDGLYRYADPSFGDAPPGSCPTEAAQAPVFGQVSALGGVLGATTVAQYHSEIDTLQFSPRFVSSQSTGLFVFGCGTLAGAVKFNVTSMQGSMTPNRVSQATLSRPGSSPQQLVLLLAQTSTLGFGDQARVVRWSPDDNTAAVRQELPVAGSYSVANASRAAALLSSFTFVPFSRSTTVVSLDGLRPPAVFPDQDVTSSFKMLEPSFFYNVNDTRFYRLAAPLQQTALPAPLVPGNGFGDHHVIRLP